MASTGHESSKWFVGLKSRPDVERALQFAPVGAFVVRVPLVLDDALTDLEVAFVLSHKLATGRVAHARVVRDPANMHLSFHVRSMFCFDLTFEREREKKKSVFFFSPLKNLFSFLSQRIIAQHSTVASSKSHLHLCDLLASHRLNVRAVRRAASLQNPTPF
jgi:hypothetical protein